MDERPPPDARAGAVGLAGRLGLAAAAVPLVETAGLGIAYGVGAFGFQHSVAAGTISFVFALVLRAGVPLVGSVLVLRGGAVTPGLVVLAAFGLLQLPTFLAGTWQVLGLGMAPWFWFGPAVAVAAGVAAGLALRGGAVDLGSFRYGGGRGLAAAGALTLAAAAVLPAVTVVSGEGATSARILGAGGIGTVMFPWVLFQLVDPAALVLLAAGLVALREPAAAVAALGGVLVVSALVDVAMLVVSVVGPLPPGAAGLAFQPALALTIGAAGLLAAGFAMLWREARA